METTFTSTVNSLQDLLETKDKAVQGLCDQLSKIKQEVSMTQGLWTIRGGQKVLTCFLFNSRPHLLSRLI